MSSSYSIADGPYSSRRQISWDRSSLRPPHRT